MRITHTAETLDQRLARETETAVASHPSVSIEEARNLVALVDSLKSMTWDPHEGGKIVRKHLLAGFRWGRTLAWDHAAQACCRALGRDDASFASLAGMSVSYQIAKCERAVETIRAIARAHPKES
jgi:hypothetical protein